MKDKANVKNIFDKKINPTSEQGLNKEQIKQDEMNKFNYRLIKVI